jgi:hypothetical protein
MDKTPIMPGVPALTAAGIAAAVGRGPPVKDNRASIANIMSPPGEFFEITEADQRPAARRVPDREATQVLTEEQRQHIQAMRSMMSPPISPHTQAVSTSSTAAVAPPFPAIQDPVLYPVDETASAGIAQPPLFAVTEIEQHKKIVENHVRARDKSTAVLFKDVSPPPHEDYELVLSFRSQVMKNFLNDRRGWLLKERALLIADRQAGAQRLPSTAPTKPIAPKPARSQRANRVSKPQQPQQQQQPFAPVVYGPGVIGLPKLTRRRPSTTPEPPSRRIVAPNREDKDFNALPDYCPPTSSLPNRANSLKVDWKGQPIDLSNDPFRHLLHPDEITLAGNLRLDCATYLTSKRRMFERRLQCLRTGKEFRKTDAQQACKIDVNKASKLWTAFDKVGWLHPEWMRKFL